MAEITVWTCRFPEQMGTLLQLVREAAQRQGTERGALRGNVYVLAPEVFSLQTEVELIRGLGLQGLLNMQVLSPESLMKAVWEYAGSGEQKPLNERGKCMALSRALIELDDREELHFYDRVARQSGLPQKLSEFLAEAASAGYTSDSLRTLAAGAESVSRASQAKYDDLARIWDEYDRLVKANFRDESMQWEEMLSRLEASRVMAGSELILACFSTLPRDLCRLAVRAAGLARRVQVVQVADSRSPDRHLFMAAGHTLDLLRGECEAGGVRMTIRESPYEARRTPALAWLERQLFIRQGRTEAPDMKGIRLHYARNTYREALFAANTLKGWHDRGMAWADMAILPMDGSDLSPILSVTLKAAGIPFYYKRDDNALRHGFSHMILASVRAACGGWQQADMLRVIKSGFVSLSPEDAMLLENYVIEHGITRGKWLQPFRIPEGEGAEAAGKLEGMRQAVVEPIRRMREVLAGRRTGARRACEAIYTYALETGSYERLREREARLYAQDMGEEMDINRQIFRIFLDILDQMAALMGDRHIRLDDLPRLLESAFLGSRVRVLPPAVDSVHIESPGLLAGEHYRAAIVMGLQERESASPANLISEQERQSLSVWIRRPFGMTEGEKIAERQEKVYSAIALPAEELVLTCSASAQNGSLLRPSSLYLEVEQLVRSSCPEQVTGGLQEADGAPLSPQLALEEIALRLRQAREGTRGLEPQWAETLRQLYGSAAWHDRTALVISGLSASNEVRPISGETAHVLFHDDVMSISRLERYAACPFSHFVRYGLRPVERGRYAFEADVKGTFYHDVLRQYLEGAVRAPAWPDLPPEEVHRRLSGILAPIREAWKNGPLDEDAAARALAEEYVRHVTGTALAMTEDAARSGFEVIGLEKAFGGKAGEKDALPPVVLTLPGGMQVALTGKIDRLDRFTDGDGKVYLRAVDYKSSPHDLSLPAMEYGLQLQLPLYLYAALQGMPGTLPGGALYMTVRDPVVEVKTEDSEEVARARLQKMRMTGMVLDEESVRRAMGEGVRAFRPRGDSPTVSCLDLDSMLERLERSVRRAGEMTEEIRRGTIAIRPAAAEGKSPCEMCAYRGICRVDRRLPGGKVLQLKSAEMNTGEEQTPN